MSSKSLPTEKHITAEEKAADSTTFFGFWMYLMTDFVLFASLFAVYLVLRANTFGGPSTYQIFNGPFALAETLILLTSSFTCGLSLLAARKGSKGPLLFWLGLTFLLGALFVGLEFSEFSRLVTEGNSWQRSGFLSSYFVLVGTHGLHVTLGLIWILALMIAIARRGLTRFNMRKLVLLATFWHFLEIIWVFIFVIVYLMGIAV
jgi:cytochrome o ubiquinol oxidase subunit 3